MRTIQKQIFVALFLFIFVAGCTSSETPPPPVWEMGEYRSDCLGRTIPQKGESTILDEVTISLEEQIAESEWLVLGTISEMSSTCYNQDGGLYFGFEEGGQALALPYYEIRLTIDETLREKSSLETQEIVITQLGYSPLDASYSPAQIGDHVVIGFREGAIAWRTTGTRSVLQPTTSFLVEQTNGTFAVMGGLPHAPLTWNEIQSLVSSH